MQKIHEKRRGKAKPAKYENPAPGLIMDMATAVKRVRVFHA